jgi:selenocysteine-specific elongation factor
MYEYPFVIGTAGHIDHGKTAVVKALSGVDCDRLSEEKRRGMTIELGFAPLTLPCGKTISIVDVPGHEKFIRQMVAGAAGVDAVMLVVAADDGVMPQTREHLEILSLLGIKNGLTVINKIDLVDEEMLEMARDDVLSLISGTFLAKGPIVNVSAETGEGIRELSAAIQDMVEKSGQKNREGPFFLPVDRAFHISGFGTVITGTAIKGTVSVDDEVEILPASVVSKVRSVQVHKEPVEKAYAGQRVALNLAGISLECVKRGDVVAAKNRFSATECMNVEVKALPSLQEPIEHWQRLRLHVGTSDVVARISLLDRGRILPGESSVAQLLTEEPLTACRNVHFILRSYSPLTTVAGGRILMPLGDRPRNKLEKNSLAQFLNIISGDITSREQLRALIDFKKIITDAEAAAFLELGPAEFERDLASLDQKGHVGILKAGARYILSLNKMKELSEKLACELDIFHKAHPERKGMDPEEVSRCLSLNDPRFSRELMRLFERLSWFFIDEDRIRLKDFEPFDESVFMRNVTALKELMRKAAYAMPTVNEAAEKLNIDAKEMNRILVYLKERRELVIVGEGFMLSDELENDFEKKLSGIDGSIALAEVRDLTGSSRKYVLPLLEYFDTKGITRRVGDKRIFLNKNRKK